MEGSGMKKFTTIFLIVWILSISISFFWNFENEKKHHFNITMRSARSLFNELIFTREWNARHGGVYVPISKTTQPNPYLKDPDRDLRINKDLVLTKINPAFMTREISEITSKKEGVRFHITSLNPLNPHNKATEREEKALKAFHQGTKEVGFFLANAKNNSFFYMAPLITTQACLKCHKVQGYKEGDIRGGISVTIPSLEATIFGPLLIAHALVGVLGILGILLFGIKLDKAYSVLRRQAEMDVLTAIPNRRNFSKKIDEELNRGKRKNEPISLLFCDIDNFKEYNDTYGHSAGDRCLRSIAQTITTSLQRPGDFCARYGGEEFVVILPDTNGSGALITAEKILRNIRSLNILHKTSLPEPIITISIGIATVEQNMTTLSAEKFVNQADQALYMAKSAGKNRAIHHSSHHQS